MGENEASVKKRPCQGTPVTLVQCPELTLGQGMHSQMLSLTSKYDGDVRAPALTDTHNIHSRTQ